MENNDIEKEFEGKRRFWYLDEKRRKYPLTPGEAYPTAEEPLFNPIDLRSKYDEFVNWRKYHRGTISTATAEELFHFLIRQAKPEKKDGTDTTNST